MPIKIPCRDCKSRKANCHSSCEEYAIFVKENEKKKQFMIDCSITNYESLVSGSKGISERRK